MRLAGPLSLVLTLALPACGGSSGSGGGSCNPGQTATLSITATGLSPAAVCVVPGGSVTFANGDAAAAHNIVFDTAGCPTAGSIAPSTSKVVVFPTEAVCAFHDANNASSAAFMGTVAVSSATVMGGGY